MSKLNSLDQYYTEPKLAERYTKLILDNYGSDNVFLEPSAGTGAFLEPLKGLNVEAYDIDPKCPGVHQADFFELNLDNKGYITIGNPPFTWDVQFFNKCAEVSKVVAFIIPRSWRKAGTINRLHKNFHLVYDETCPDQAFILDGKPWTVSTCFQVWERKDEVREKIKFKSKYFDVVPRKGSWDFIMRFYGSQAGKILSNEYNGNESTVRFIQQKIPNLRSIICELNFDERRKNVSSMPAINPIEVEEEIEKWITSNQLNIG